MFRKYCVSLRNCVQSKTFASLFIIIYDLSQNYCISQRNFAFACKTLGISCKTTVFPHEALHSLTKHLQYLDKQLCSSEKRWTCYKIFQFSWKAIAFPLKILCSFTKHLQSLTKICNLLQNYCVPLRNFLFTCKIFTIYRTAIALPKKYCVRSKSFAISEFSRETFHSLQNICNLLQNDCVSTEKKYCVPLKNTV